MILSASNRNYIRNALALLSGTAIAQIIGVLTAPILTRLYSPSEFGSFSIYLNIVMLAVVISCLRYEVTIVLPKQSRTALLLVLLSALIAGVLSLSMWVPIIAFEATIQKLVGLGVEDRLLLVLPVSFMLAAFYRIVSNWAVRNKDYTGLSLSKLWQSLPQTAGQISFGFLYLGTWGLVVGEIIGRLLGLLSLTFRNKEIFGGIRHVHPQRMRTLVSHYRHYPLYSSWSVLLNEAGSVAPVFFLATIYGPGTAGLFALVQRVFALPMDLIGQTALTMYMGEASQAIRTSPGRLHSLFLRTVVPLLVLAAIPASLLIWRGPQLFEAIFGHEWHAAGAYAQIVAVAYGVRMAVSPISQTLQIMGRQKFILLIEVTRLLSIISVFIGGQFLKLDVEAVLLWYAGILIIFQMWVLLVTWTSTKSVEA